MSQVWFSLIGLVMVYAVLLTIEMWLMLKFIRLGPASLHTGRYHGETPAHGDDIPAVTPHPALS